MRASGKASVWGIGGVMLMVSGMALTPIAARASADGRKNTAIGIGALAAIELLRGKTTEGLLLGAGAAYAGKLYEDDRRAERDRSSRRYHQGDSYNTGSSDGYASDGNGNDGGDYETYSGSDLGLQRMSAAPNGRAFYRSNRGRTPAY